MEVPGAVKAAISLAQIPFEYGRRVRKGDRLPQELERIHNYREWLLNEVHFCKQSRNDINVQPWITQLGTAKNILDKVKPENRKGVWDKHVERDVETLNHAHALILSVHEQLTGTISLRPQPSDAFKVHYWAPDRTNRSFTYCDQPVDEHGMIREGRLRELLLSKTTSSNSIVGTRVYCAHGPGGMGKTVALEWLGCDVQVRRHFTGGIHWFSFGAGVEDRTIMERIRVCALNCEQTELADELKNEVSVQVAIRKLGDKFKEKTVLLLVDDVWAERKEELILFKKCLDKGNECAVVLTCRENGIADVCHEAVRFDFLDPLGDISRNVLLSYVDDHNRGDVHGWMESSTECRSSFEAGLRECGGWVLCLSIAGALLRDEIGDCDDIEEARESLWDWAQSLVEDADFVGEGTRDYPRGLGHIVDQGLEQAKQNLKKKKISEVLSSTISDKFDRLCVMQKQKPMPVQVLMGLWRLNKKDTVRVAKALREMSLLKLESVKGVGEVIRVHDKIIDLCRERVGENIYRKHEELLEAFLESSRRIHWHEDVWYRPWWELSAKHEYVMEHLGYHLGEAKLKKELWGLLCDARFMMRWLEDGRGWIGVAENFERVRAGLGTNGSLDELRRALESSWSPVRASRHTLGFEMFGRLEKGEDGGGNESVRRFLQSLEQFERGPWLQPAKPYLLRLDTREKCCYEPRNGQPCWISEDCSRVVLFDDSALTVYELKTQEVVHRFDLPEHDWVVVPVVSTNGNYALFVYATEEEGNKAVLVDLMKNTGLTIVLGEALKKADSAGRAEITSYAVHSQELFALGFDDGSVVLAHVLGGKRLQCTLMPLGHNDRVYRVVLNADGTRVASASEDKTVRVWRVSDGERLCLLSGHDDGVNCVAFNADGTRVVSGSVDHTVRVWSVSDGQQLCSLSGHKLAVRCVSFSANGSHVVSAGKDLTVRVWSVSDGEQLCSLSGHHHRVNCVGFSADGTRVVSGSRDETVRVWSISDGEMLVSLTEHVGWVTSVAFSADGMQVVSGSNDKTVRVWSVSDGEQLYSLCGHEEPVNCVAFSADGIHVVSGSDDGTVRVWSVSGGEQLYSLGGHEFPVFCVAFSADGRRVVSGSLDRTVRVWSLGDGEQLCSLYGHESPVKCVAFSADGRRVVSGSYDKTVRLWSVEDEVYGTLHEWNVSDVAECVRFVSGSEEVEALISGSWVSLRRGTAGHSPTAEKSPWIITEDSVCVRQRGADTDLRVVANFSNADCYASHWASKSTVHGTGGGRVIICRLRNIP